MQTEQPKPTRVTGGTCGFPTGDGGHCNGTPAIVVESTDDLPDTDLVELTCPECGSGHLVGVDRVRDALDA